jgi:hypothetical protein
MTVGNGEIIATVTATNEDYEVIDYVGAEAILTVGGASVGTPGALDYETDIATSTATSSISTGQTYLLQGNFGACQVHSGGGGRDDDDGDDDGPRVKPAFTAPGFYGDGGSCSFFTYDLQETVQTGVPSITSISPSSGTVGDTNKTISVSGDNLEDELGLTGVSITGSGVTSSVSSPGTLSATVTYAIPSSATSAVGAQTLTMFNSFGTSNARTFTIGYPPAVVNSLSSYSWQAASSFTRRSTEQDLVRHQVLAYPERLGSRSVSHSTRTQRAHKRRLQLPSLRMREMVPLLSRLRRDIPAAACF